MIKHHISQFQFTEIYDGMRALSCYNSDFFRTERKVLSREWIELESFSSKFVRNLFFCP